MDTLPQVTRVEKVPDHDITRRAISEVRRSLRPSGSNPLCSMSGTLAVSLRALEARLERVREFGEAFAGVDLSPHVRAMMLQAGMNQPKGQFQ